jgi:hypothetical protein
MPDDAPKLFEKLAAVATFVRDVGLIIGIPTVIIAGMNLYDLQKGS